MRYPVWCLLGLLLLLTACSENYAPVSSGMKSPLVASNVHHVTRGETLYAIAWRYDMDYRRLAAVNHLRPPYELAIGQKLRLTSPQRYPITPKRRRPIVHKTMRPTTTKRYFAKAPPPQQHAPLMVSGIKWYWPVKGKLIGGYAPANGFKGINIASTMGTPIHAAAPGRVAYSGNGLRGYGNLIIIKHNDEYLSAYAHNSKNLVKEGQMVTSGEVIATMGNTEAQTVMLHFEIRKAGQSVNPLQYLR